MANVELNVGMFKQTRPKAKRPTTAALKDRRCHIKARVIDAAEVLALKGAKEAKRDGQKNSPLLFPVKMPPGPVFGERERGIWYTAVRYNRCD